MQRMAFVAVLSCGILAYTAAGHKPEHKDIPPNLPIPPLLGPGPQSPDRSQAQPGQPSVERPGGNSGTTSSGTAQQSGVSAASQSSPSTSDEALSPLSPPSQQYTFQLGVRGSISVPDCEFPTQFPPLNEWQRWSSPSTWGPAGPPGPDDTATIYCGQYVLFDMPLGPGGAPSAVLRTLNITGVLMFADDRSVGDLHLAAQFIIIHGMLLIGSPSQHFSHKATITLLPSPTPELAEGYEDLGSKVMAVVGGQVKLYGMPGGPSTPSWVRLSGNVEPSSSSIKLDRPVFGWPVGGEIVVASTDFDGKQSERAVITAIDSSGTLLQLDRPLVYGHWGTNFSTGIAGRVLTQAAEVALLSRNILVTAVPDSEDPLIGGHFVVYQTSVEQAISGVEFTKLGQQGRLGRYPVHFHLCHHMPTTVVDKCSVHDTFQRCYVTHGTFQLTWDSNVAYNNTGHCFFIEDGVESGNNYYNNLGIYSERSKRVLTKVAENQPKNETDTDAPTMFWVSNPNNTFVGNVAVGGGAGARGFWFELIGVVKAESAAFPETKGLNPSKAPLGLFTDNLAHSLEAQGMSMYKNGYSPANLTSFKRNQVYKVGSHCVRLHGSSRLSWEDGIVSDCRIGIDLSSGSGEFARNNVIVGHTDNVGNAVNCRSMTNVYTCAPLDGCPNGTLVATAVPNNPGTGWRTIPNLLGTQKRLGINLGANVASGNAFVNMDSEGCFRSGAASWFYEQSVFVPVAGHISGTTFVNTDVNRFYNDLTRSIATNVWYILFDEDGTFAGSGPGAYVVPQGNPLLLPPASPSSSVSCVPKPEWSAYVCTGACYRSVRLEYNEPGSYTMGVAPSGPVSYLLFTRTADREYLSTLNQTGTKFAPGNVKADKSGQAYFPRAILVSLLAGPQYQVSWEGVAAQPEKVDVVFADSGQPGPGCSEAISLSFPTGQAISVTATKQSVPLSPQLVRPGSSGVTSVGG